MNRLTASLLVLVIALAATSTWAWRQLQQERQRSGELRARLEQGNGAVASTSSVTDEGVVAAPGATPGDAPADKEAQSAEAEDVHAVERRMLQNESYREARRRFRQLELARGHVDIAKVMGISQETADRLLALLVERELSYSDRPFRNPRNEKELRLRQMENQQSQHERDAEIAAVIGAANLPRWKEYQASLRERHWVNDMSARMTGEGEPLRDDQVNQLVAAMYSERRRAQQELLAYGENLTWSEDMQQKSMRYRDERYAELARIADQRVRAAAASILTTKQRAVFEDRLKRERDYQDAEAAQSRAWDEAAGAKSN